jgi:hypothetical protein
MPRVAATPGHWEGDPAVSDPQESPEERPRPQFGEYATPEEQRARIRQPSVTDHLSDGIAPPPPAAPPFLPPPAPVSGAAVRRPRLIDRVATFVLLGYGLVTVLSAIPQFVDFTGFVSTLSQVMGLRSDLPVPASGRAWGIAAAVVLGVGWLATFVLSWAVTRSGRLAFWIPLVAGAVINILASFLVVVPLLSDPAFLTAIQSVGVIAPSPTAT